MRAWGVVSARLQPWRSVDGPLLPNPQHIGTGTRQRGASPRPGAVPTSPWPPPAPNINFLHPLILLARMQGVLPLTQRVLGGRVGWPGWGALAKLPTQNPTLTRLQATPSPRCVCCCCCPMEVSAGGCACTADNCFVRAVVSMIAIHGPRPSHTHCDTHTHHTHTHTHTDGSVLTRSPSAPGPSTLPQSALSPRPHVHHTHTHHTHYGPMLT
jgi:hypothetical protein